MATGLTTGFKKKCLNEIKAIKKLGEARPLTEEELRECNRGAAESVKDRFEKNQVDSLFYSSQPYIQSLPSKLLFLMKIVIAFGLS